jgi:hypothetical protein
MNKEFTLDPSKIKKSDVVAMIKYELEEIKQFLEKENDEGKLNLNALVVLGVGEGTILGMNWAMNDWSWPSVGKKQGQDVKALVMITPVKMFEGITNEAPAKHPVISRLPTLLVTGNDKDEQEELEKLRKLLDKTRGPGTAESVGPLVVHVEPNKGSGIRLANEKRVIETILKFLKDNVVTKGENFPWLRRNQS